jgi:hypothetical protein
VSTTPRFIAGVPDVDSAAEPDTADAFIGGAPGKQALPWLAQNIRDDHWTQVNVRQPYRLIAAANYLKTHWEMTLKAYIQSALEDAVAADLAKLGLPSLPPPRSPKRYRHR